MTRLISTQELDELLHPARAYAHPLDVLRDPALSAPQKRAILASWASDACAVEASPMLRVTPGGTAVQWDDIMDALQLLDAEGGAAGKFQPRKERTSDALCAEGQ